MSRYTDVMRTREHELPPRWDGQPVTWLEPTAGRGVMICTRGGGCRPGGDFVCTGCGTLDEAFDVYVGRIRVPGALYDTGRLQLQRCLACAHDQVLELDADFAVIATWDLDETDYGDDGSVPPDPETLW